MDQYCCLAGESKAKSTFPPESNRSVNLKYRSSAIRLWSCVCDSRQMCGAACILNKDVTMPATELLSSRCLTRPLKHYTTHRVGAQHHNSFKIQMWETKRTPPGGTGRVTGRDMLQPTKKHPYTLIRSLENDQSKCHLGSSFWFYKLAGSCLLSQYPRSAKLQHLQIFHFMPQIHYHFCKQRFINQLLERLLLTRTHDAETVSSDPVLRPIRQQDQTGSGLRFRSSVKDIVSTWWYP